MKLVFIYNAQRGFLHGILDSFHKLIIPSTYPCKLCLLTYGFFRKRKSWAIFLQSTGVETVFIYRKDAGQYITKFGPPPMVLIKYQDRTELICSAVDMEDMQNLDGLINLIRKKIDQTNNLSENT